MTASKTFKFAGSTIAVLTGFSTNSPSLDITGITKANPPVVTITAHGLVDGDVVKLHDIGGMTELNNEVAIVNVLTSSTFELLGFDSTDNTTWTSGGQIDVGTFSNFCELTGYNRQGGSSAEIDSTSLCSTAKEYEIGLPDFGTTQLDFKFAPRTAIQLAIATFDESKDKMAVRVDLPKSGGRMVQLAFIQQTSEAAANGGIWTGSITVKNTGKREDFAAA
jgi:hypothetical protein